MTREELKQADTKKLISALQYCGRDSYYTTYYDEVVDEITQRLERIEELEKENAELKEINEGYNRNRDKLIAMGFPTFKSCKEYSGKLTNLQKENATLKKQLEALSGDIPWNELKDVSEVTKELTKAKELLAKWVELYKPKIDTFLPTPIQVDTEQFLSEVEK